MVKHVVIIGAGISGLATAWFLQKKHGNRLKITILEKTNRVGGSLQTICQDDFLFELGPHSIRGGEEILEFVRELEMEKELIFADPSSKRRYLFLQKRLRKLPSNPFEILKTPWIWPLVPSLIAEYFKPPKPSDDETVQSFFLRRFGKKITDSFIDPMCLGIYAGDIGELSIRSCFPFFYEWERSHGSVIRGSLRNRQQSTIFSFLHGTEELPKRIAERLRADFLFNAKKIDVKPKQNKVKVLFDQDIEADRLIFAIPPSQMFSTLSTSSLFDFKTIPVTVVHLGYHQSVLRYKGFGYLVPSSEKKTILGVIWHSSVFPQQNGHKEQTRLTVMIGGAPNKENCTKIALESVREQLEINTLPDSIHVSIHDHAIPQYTLGHHLKVDCLEKQLVSLSPRISFLGNHFYGVSISDCISKAKMMAQKLDI